MDSLEQLSGHQILATSRGAAERPGVWPCGAGGRMEKGGCAAEPQEAELQLQSLALHCSLARTGPGRRRWSSRLNFDPLGN